MKKEYNYYMSFLTKDKSNVTAEIIRFLIVGVAATIGDYLTKLLIAYLIPKGSMPDWLEFGIPIVCGFIIGVLINYFLSIVFVFKNVDKNKNVKSQSNFWLFVLLGFVGMLIGLGIFYAFRYSILALSNGSFDINVGKDDMNLSSPVFWAYFGVFCFQTIVVLVYNYCSRKKFIFKVPKAIEENDKETSIKEKE